MQKAEYYQMVGKRLSDAMERLHYTQQQMLLKCAEQGYTINQSSLSKMLSGGSIQTLQIVQICYLLFHYDFLAYQNLECRLVTVITVSSGVKRLPTMHKLLLTRTQLTPDDLEYLCGQLKLNNSEILMSENAYREFLRDPQLPEKFFEYFGERETYAEGFLSSVARIPYITFNESLISDSFLPPFDKIKIICLLRKYSSAPRYNKISGKADEIVYNYLRLRKESDLLAKNE